MVISPTGTGNFVGGTTPLDDATVVPNAAYVNLVAASFDPTVILGATPVTHPSTRRIPWDYPLVPVWQCSPRPRLA